MACSVTYGWIEHRKMPRKIACFCFQRAHLDIFYHACQEITFVALVTRRLNSFVHPLFVHNQINKINDMCTLLYTNDDFIG